MNWKKNIEINRLLRNSIADGFVENNLVKAKELPIGSIRTHGGQKVKKVSKDKWVPVSEQKNAKQSERNDQDTTKQDKAQKIIDGEGSKSEKARQLADLGMKTSSIAKYLDMNYSHAYSTIKKHKEKQNNSDLPKQQDGESNSTPNYSEQIERIEQLIFSNQESNSQLAAVLLEGQSELKKQFIQKWSGVREFLYEYADGVQISKRDSDLEQTIAALQSKELYFTAKKIDNIDALSGLKNLKTLRLNYTKIDNIDTLSNLTNLEYLDLGGTKIDNIDTLSNLTNLETLRLDNMKIDNIDALSNLTNLEYLDLESTKIDNIDALSNLTNLETLRLDNTKIDNIDALSGLKNLEVLRLDNTKIDNIDALSNLTNLNEISLLDVNVSENQIKRLQKNLPKTMIY